MPKCPDITHNYAIMTLLNAFLSIHLSENSNGI